MIVPTPPNSRALLPTFRTHCPHGSHLPRIPPPTPVLYSAVTHTFWGYACTQNTLKPTPKHPFSWPELKNMIKTWRVMQPRTKIGFQLVVETQSGESVLCMSKSEQVCCACLSQSKNKNPQPILVNSRHGGSQAAVAVCESVMVNFGLSAQESRVISGHSRLMFRARSTVQGQR